MEPNLQKAMDTGDSARSGRLKVDAGHKNHRPRGGKKCLVCAIKKNLKK